VIIIDYIIAKLAKKLKINNNGKHAGNGKINQNGRFIQKRNFAHPQSKRFGGG
jgi:hypothetical protein